MKDGLKWVILVFVAALLILLVVTQKDKFMKASDEAAQVNLVTDVQPAEEVAPAPAEETVDAEETVTSETEVTVEVVDEVDRPEVRLDENGIEIAP